MLTSAVFGKILLSLVRRKKVVRFFVCYSFPPPRSQQSETPLLPMDPAALPPESIPAMIAWPLLYLPSRPTDRRVVFALEKLDLPAKHAMS